jgi:hypothetical protein
MSRASLVLLLLVASLVGCSNAIGDRDDAGALDGARLDASRGDASGFDGSGGEDAAIEEADAMVPSDAPLAPDVPVAPCRTRIWYGSTWIHGSDHLALFDDAAGEVTWDGVCTDDGANSYATLSNGWRPYFTGHSCLIAFDRSGSCESDACRTRITYGSTWMRAPGHAADYDEVGGIVTWDGACGAAGGAVSATLSNGWAPHFAGRCTMSLRYEGCGGLYTNPVIDEDCPDPGVTFDGTQYVLSCTSGNFRLYTSPDLVTWTRAGAIFPSRPSWASGDLWAPEIHRVEDRWVVYYSARNAADGRLAVGAATGPSALGPFTDLGRPLVRNPAPGVIDAHHFEAPDGRHFLTFKVDGNAVGAPTPILIQRLANDGVTLMGSATEILRNDRSWEGALVEGQWMIEEGGTYYLFYSANGYASTRYAMGVARSDSPLGPFTKASGPIVTSNGTWSGPGHGSVLRGPGGDWIHVYHAWRAGRVGESPGRLVLVDRITFEGGWPVMRSAPMGRSQPMP